VTDLRARILAARDGGVVKLAPPATEDEVARFEADHGVTLPHHYRWFLLHAGNGGHGPPYYGIEPLSDRAIEAGSFLAPEENHNGRLADPFRGREDDWSDREPEEADEEWAAREAGRLLLGTDGCAILWVLGLNGDARGEVWRLGDDTARRSAATFIDWYVEWLDARGPKPDDPVPLALADELPTGRRVFLKRLRR
jgi:hypothetical protein